MGHGLGRSPGAARAAPPLDANIFYPDRNTLAYSESLIVQSAIAAPFLWLGASPVLAYTIVLMAGFTLTGWAMCLVVRRWTGDWIAGLASGILVAFNAHSFTRLPHLQAQHVEFLLPALAALDALLRDPRAARAVRLAMWFTLQALTSLYLLVFTAAPLTAAALARPETWLGKRFVKPAPLVALAAGISTLALLPFLLPYWHVYQAEGALTGAATAATTSAASWSYYLSTPSRLEFPLFSHRWFTGDAFFPGWWPPMSVALLTLIALEPSVAPIHFHRFEGIPSIYARLRDARDAVVAEMPFYYYTASFHNAPYMLGSTRHWKPLVNGYSGFQPSSFRRNARLFSGFPNPSSVAALQAAGVTHVFVHVDQYGPAIVDRLAHDPAFHEVASEKGIVLYQLDSPAQLVPAGGVAR